FLYHLDFTYASSAGLLAYAPCILEVSPQVGVLCGIPLSPLAAAPSGWGPGRCTSLTRYLSGARVTSAQRQIL
ncbi:MAG: hypothetical protein ACK53Y_01150, partial [bacterium]